MSFHVAEKSIKYSASKLWIKTDPKSKSDRLSFLPYSKDVTKFSAAQWFKYEN